MALQMVEDEEEDGVVEEAGEGVEAEEEEVLEGGVEVEAEGEEERYKMVKKLIL